MKHTLSLHIFRHKRKLMWLGDEFRRSLSKLYDINHPNNRWRWRLNDEPPIVPTKFITGNKGG